MMISIVAMGTVSNSLLLGLLTIFVWDFKTALWLSGGTLVLLVLEFVVAFLLMKFINRSRGY